MGSKDMTWPEMQYAKRLAEEKVRDAIQQLHDDTGLKVEGVMVVRADVTGMNDGNAKYEHKVELDVRV